MSASSDVLQNAVQIREFQSQTSFVSCKSYSSCRICLSHILDPAVLTCGHKFCEKCLFQYWDERDKPEFIVCPLCRANAFKVDFAKKEATSTTADFRRTFNPMAKLTEAPVDKSNLKNFCFKLSLLIPIFYCTLNWIHLPIELFMWVWHMLVKMEYKL